MAPKWKNGAVSRTQESKESRHISKWLKSLHRFGIFQIVKIAAVFEMRPKHATKRIIIAPIINVASTIL